nr:hypothetical protein [Tanacetum cinerariifolium]
MSDRGVGCLQPHRQLAGRGVLAVQLLKQRFLKLLDRCLKAFDFALDAFGHRRAGDVEVTDVH